MRCDAGNSYQSIYDVLLKRWEWLSLGRETVERREFIKIVCGLVGTWPIVAYAQQVGELRRIGVLGADATVWSSWTAAFVTRLRELRWTTGETIDVDYRWAGGSSKRVSDFTAEFLRRNVDVIVTYGAAAAVVQQATTTTPIVLAVASDPGVGLLARRPDGNVTGISIRQSELISKRLDLLREVVPHLRRLVIMGNAGYAMPVLEAQEAKAAAQALGLEAARLQIWQSEDIAPAFEAIRGKADALYVVSDALIAANRTLINTLALSARLPTMLSYGDYVKAGGLMSYGPNYANLFRQAADMVDKILRGTKPGDIPVEQPSNFELVINPETAKALGITVPESLLANAD
jgi:putative ABC transport system substrate-binding protein